MEHLLAAIETGDDYHAERLMRRISADGWREILRNVDKRDTRAFFPYLATTEGRKRQGFVLADSSPLRDEDGCAVAPRSGKVELITGTFRREFCAPAAINPSACGADPHLYPLAPFRGATPKDFTRARQLDVRKTPRQMSTNKASGSDGIPSEPYRNLPSLAPYLTALIEVTYRPGHTLRTLRVVPPPKAGKDLCECANKRPIPPPCASMKVVENVIYQRMAGSSHISVVVARNCIFRCSLTECSDPYLAASLSILPPLT